MSVTDHKHNDFLLESTWSVDFFQHSLCKFKKNGPLVGVMLYGVNIPAYPYTCCKYPFHLFLFFFAALFQSRLKLTVNIHKKICKYLLLLDIYCSK